MLRFWLTGMLAIFLLGLGVSVWRSAQPDALNARLLRVSEETISLENEPGRFELSAAAEVRLKTGTTDTLTLSGNEDVLEALEITQTPEGVTVAEDPNVLERVSWTREELVITVETKEPPSHLLFLKDTLVEGENLQNQKLTVESRGRLDGYLNQVAVETLEIALVGEGDLEVTGEGDAAKLRITGPASLETAQFSVNTVQAQVSGPGVIRVNPQESLQAQVQGTGGIFYTRKPAKIMTSVQGNGKIGLD